MNLQTTLHIKNVVCQRCKMTLQHILERLKIPYVNITLGEVELKKPLTVSDKQKLTTELQQVGFSLLLDKNEQLVNKIKSVLIEVVYKEKNFGNKKLSEILKDQLSIDYSHISNLFTKVEGKSIQNFYNALQMERVKELLEYGEINIAEIAYDLGYSNAAYLSSRFKRATGYSPSEYKQKFVTSRKALDKV